MTARPPPGCGQAAPWHRCPQPAFRCAHPRLATDLFPEERGLRPLGKHLGHPRPAGVRARFAAAHGCLASREAAAAPVRSPPSEGRHT